ncbi:MAG: response regulator transcription factor [Crocinitomicaceae bacterium]|nr:response regulator transcription factor [Crocinitomicaceae bacterium]
MKRILLVEDELSFGDLLANYLKISGYDVTWCKDGSTGYSAVMQNDFDLCILDVMMPNMDGFTLGEKIKEKKNNTPFFYLTAKNMKEDLIKGYGIGADDYLTKPFDTDVLLLKINAILNRTALKKEVIKKEVYEIDHLTFKPKTRMLISGNEETKLSPKEAALLELLCQHMNTVMPRDLALNEIWKENNYFTKRSMDVYINKLRKRFSDSTKIQIETFHQMGFQLQVKP